MRGIRGPKVAAVEEVVFLCHADHGSWSLSQRSQNAQSSSVTFTEPRLEPKTAWRRKTATLPVDADGNLTQDGRWDYQWHAENHLTSMTAISSLPAAAKKKLEFVLGSGTVLRSYAWGLDLSGSMQGAGGVGGLLAMNNTSDSSSHFYAYDGNGNVVALVNAATGAVSAEYEYGPFGETIRQTGTMAAANTHRFSTKVQDDTSGLLYYGYRYLNTSTGRFINKDPLGEAGGINLYGFCQNDGINIIDKFGLLSAKTAHGPIFGKYGDAEWDIEWILGADEKDGFVMQHVTIDVYRCDCATKVCSLSKTTSYYETWKVNGREFGSDGRFDFFISETTSTGECGMKWWTAEAAFYPEESDKEFPAGFHRPIPDAKGRLGYSGGLPTNFDPTKPQYGQETPAPSPWGGLNKVPHNWKIKWECNGETTEEFHTP